MEAIEHLFDEKITLSEASRILNISPIEVLSLADPKTSLYDKTFPVILLNSNGDHRISKKDLIQWQGQKKPIHTESKQEFISSKQLACFFSVTPSTVRRWISKGRIPAPDIVAPHLLRWRTSTLKDFLANPNEYLGNRAKYKKQ